MKDKEIKPRGLKNTVGGTDDSSKIQRSACLSHYDAGGELSHAEIARKLGITEEYARVLEWSALRKIRRHLGASRWHEWREALREGFLS